MSSAESARTSGEPPSDAPRRRKRALAFAAGLGVLLAGVAGAMRVASSGPTPSGAAAATMADTASVLRDRALADGEAYRFVVDLTTRVGARPAGSAADREAVVWAEERLRAMGLEEVRTEAVTVPHWVRGEAEGTILDPFPVPVVLAALGGSPGTPDEGVEAEVVRVGTVDDLHALPADAVRGRIVFFDDVMEPSQSGIGYGETVEIRGDGPREAARRGAVAAIIRSVGTGPHRFAHTGGTRYTEEDRTTRLVRPIPAAALAIPDAEILARRLAESEGPVRFRLRLTARMLPDAQSANVIGEVRGRERPAEIVLLGCHLDSWDLGTGAHDDAAGCGIVAAAASLIAALPERPRRTIRVVLFANEEFGLSGAEAYAKRHAAELGRHVLGVEADLGADRAWRFATRVAPKDVERYAPLAAVLEPLGIAHGGNDARGGADLIPLRRPRVPMADLNQDARRYFELHHTLDDTVANVDPEQLAQNVAAYAALAWWAAELPGELGRAPAPDPPSAQVATWSCADGTVFVTELDADGLRVYLPDRAPLLAAGSGAAPGDAEYAAEGAAFEVRADEATLEVDGRSLAGCRRVERGGGEPRS